MQTFDLHKLGFNQNCYTLSLTLLIDIVLRSKFLWTKFTHYKCFDMKFVVLQVTSTFLRKRSLTSKQMSSEWERPFSIPWIGNDFLWKPVTCGTNHEFRQWGYPFTLKAGSDFAVPCGIARLLLLLDYSRAWSWVIQKSMSLRYEPSSERAASFSRCLTSSWLLSSVELSDANV